MGCFLQANRLFFIGGLHVQHVRWEEHQNSACKNLIFCILCCLQLIRQTQDGMVLGFQNTLWLYLTSEFHEDQRLALPEMCLKFASWSQLQHGMLDKFNKIHSLKKENIISTLGPIPLIFLNILKAAMGMFNLRTVLTCLRNSSVALHMYESPSVFCSLEICVWDSVCVDT